MVKYFTIASREEEIILIYSMCFMKIDWEEKSLSYLSKDIYWRCLCLYTLVGSNSCWCVLFLVSRSVICGVSGSVKFVVDFAWGGYTYGYPKFMKDIKMDEYDWYFMDGTLYKTYIWFRGKILLLEGAIVKQVSH